jgi:16S rRNA (cytosine967-C5)-methyltransferase
MKFAAQLSAAIEILSSMETSHKPVSDAVKDWGTAHRFAGSKDRAAIASLVYDVLRKRASSAWRMGTDTPRALTLGMLVVMRGFSSDNLAALLATSPHAPESLTPDEIKAIDYDSVQAAPDWVRGDYPEWMDLHMGHAFGDSRVEEAQALATRAPLDVRVNSLKGDRAKALRALEHLKATETPWSPIGLRIPLLEDGRGPPVQSEPAFIKGLIEVQDEGSQLAALLSGAAPGEQVIDMCAGAGGKTLALAAAMGNSGQIFAYDSEIRRLKHIYDRLERAGVRNVQVRSPKGRGDNVLEDLNGRADLVLVDAPCTGAGTWRRNPDAKWRLRQASIADRQKSQDLALETAAPLVKKGGRLAYVTCSFLPEENESRIVAFRTRHPEFEPVTATLTTISAGLPGLAAEASAASGNGLLLTPYRTGTDGFFIAVLKRKG